MIKFTDDHTKIIGYVEAIKMTPDGEIIERRRSNTINNVLKDLIARTLYYGTETPSDDVPTFRISRILFGGSSCYSSGGADTATALCNPYGLVSGWEGNLVIAPEYMYISSGPSVSTAEVRYGIVLPVNYPFNIGGVDRTEYDLVEAGLYAYVGGTEKMIAWTYFDPVIHKTAADVIAFSWVIRIQ